MNRQPYRNAGDSPHLFEKAALALKLFPSTAQALALIFRGVLSLVSPSLAVDVCGIANRHSKQSSTIRWMSRKVRRHGCSTREEWMAAVALGSE